MTAIFLLSLWSTALASPNVPVPAPSVAPATPPPEAAPPVALTAPEVFTRTKGLVFKIDTRLKNTHSEREHGSGFVVDADGLLATNYHVVADWIADPNKYELVAKLAAGDVPARVVAIDPVNDIAVVKVEKTAFAGALSPTLAQPPVIGDALFSIGFPKSEEITITQGNFNGQRQMGFAPVIALSMPLNPGMSGGPCLDRFGRVVGVNRAIQSGAQNISYLSPNEALNAIIARAQTAPAPANFNWQKSIAGDIAKQESLATAKPLAGERQRLGQLSFVAPIVNAKCGQDKVENISVTAQEFMICQSPSLALLGAEQGSLQITIVAVRSESRLNPPSAFRALAPRYQKSKDAKAPGADGRSLASLDRPRAMREKCKARSITNSSNVPISMRFCSVEIPQFPGLYNTFVKVEVEDARHATTSFAQAFEGMTLAATGTLLETFAESIHFEK